MSFRLDYDAQLKNSVNGNLTEVSSKTAEVGRKHHQTEVPAEAIESDTPLTWGITSTNFECVRESIGAEDSVLQREAQRVLQEPEAKLRITLNGFIYNYHYNCKNRPGAHQTHPWGNTVRDP